MFAAVLLHGRRAASNPHNTHIYVSLQAAHDNVDMSSDIVHYPGCSIIRFMPSYGRFQYGRVLYHDYERSGRWDAVCISLRQNEVDQYTRGGLKRGALHVFETVFVCGQTALGDQKASKSVSFTQFLFFLYILF